MKSLGTSIAELNDASIHLAYFSSKITRVQGVQERPQAGDCCCNEAEVHLDLGIHNRKYNIPGVIRRVINAVESQEPQDDYWNNRKAEGEGGDDHEFCFERHLQWPNQVDREG